MGVEFTDGALADSSDGKRISQRGEPMTFCLQFRKSYALSLCLTLALASSADAAKTPGGVLCEKKKLEATAKLLKCRQDADAVYGKTQNETKRDKDYARCERRLTDTYTRLETKVFPATGAPDDTCPTYGDAANIIAFGAAATALVTNGQASALGEDALCPDLCAGVSCAAVDQCHEAGTCDPQTGGCSTPDAPDGTACDDGNSGTLDDICIGGVCDGAPCGGSDQSCCATSQCDGRNNCNKGTCRLCGGIRNPTCQSGDPCDPGVTPIQGICTFGPALECGDFSGEPCCPGELCAPGLTCESGSGTCSD